jgi:predicted  nucleic acid-binding Zn-ribbon protein
MPDTKNLEARVAALEENARSTSVALQDILTELRETRQELRVELRGIRQDLRVIRSDHRWPLGILLGAVVCLIGLMARRYGWL